MRYPQFFDTIEKIILKDDLAMTLGALEDGILEFSYLDLVKSAGHSCPTVAGAYLSALIGLKTLYKDTLPKRGEIEVYLPDPATFGVSGVIGSVLATITGATTDYGFKGLGGGQFARTNLMHFDTKIAGSVKFLRKDTQESITLIYDPSILQSKLQGWQERVEEIFQNSDKVIRILK